MTLRPEILKESIEEREESDVISDVSSAKDEDEISRDAEENEKDKKNEKNFEQKIKDFNEDASEVEEVLQDDDVNDDIPGKLSFIVFHNFAIL